ncbi:mechanosensitive ion channel protein MscL [Boudabousia liubingyangii]|uniref:Large-conductance mechanosensitive channel n=1 Tax=Boudabousia liubingyangii TaxID=1921764 RepID=A0A1Q5PLB2_9ACTO|nr:large conductance mechanosensitive channel protein MscL [Boudabousia liubingyangii]OKL47096.1 mechanosensitive ion channel protein MscL [Boudabousia liubingyangii]OKL47841.1 mechanosensitive ion channel protein MscL [Boudabousia liubingyangii]
MIKGFKEFISQGNVVDMAVGVIIAGAFAPIVKAVTDFILAFIAAIFGAPNFDQLGAFVVNGAHFYPGTILTALINFLIVAAAVYFFVVVPINNMRARKATEEAAPEAPAADVALLAEIRDLLKAGR